MKRHKLKVVGFTRLGSVILLYEGQRFFLRKAPWLRLFRGDIIYSRGEELQSTF
jgi:hypothetical protein